MTQVTETAGTTRRSIRVPYLSRVEGEGGLYVRLDGDRVEEVKINIFEPPRFFEAFLQGRHFTEVPDITARICGICPVAYQMSAVHAFEAALGVTITPEIRLLRRLLYLGEYIESHALHIYLLQAPDFLGYESAISLAKDHPDVVEKGLRLKKTGNDLLEVLGGRPSHGVSVCVGGFHRMPRKRDLLELRGRLENALQAAKETVDLVSTFTFPQFVANYEFVSLSHPHEYPLNERRIVSSRGIDVEPSDFEMCFLEEHVEHSTALHSVRVPSASSYLVGPLARVNLNFDKLSSGAREAARASGIEWPCRNPFKGVVARAIELVHACEESLAIISTYQEPEISRVPYEVRASEGCAATEAPRGVLYHRYRINNQGLVEFAKITPPTAQNLRRMEDDLRMFIPAISAKADQDIALDCEALIRCYDPCISCSTHFLHLTLDRR